MPLPNPGQLSYEEGVELLHQIVEFGDPLPHLILTGGDPLAHPDLWELMDVARGLGIGVSITPAAASALTRGQLERLGSLVGQAVANALPVHGQNAFR